MHKRSWRVHFSTDLTVGSGQTMPPDPDKLKDYVRRYYPDHQIAIAYEAGPCGFSAARQFLAFGWETLVINPADLPKTNPALKTDKIDAQAMAKQLRAGNLRSIHIPAVPRECLRSLSRQRTALVRDFRKIKTRIKGLLLYYDLGIPPQFDNATWSKAFLRWLEELQWNYPTIELTLQSMLDQYHFIDTQIKTVTKKLKAYCRRKYPQDYTLLRSVPGIGALTAAYLLAEIGDLRRFNAFKQFAAYVGIVPRIHASGEKQHIYGVSPRANATIRSLIVESSWVAIRIDPVLQAYYRKHAQHNSKAALFKVAHKLLSRIHAVIKNQTPYQIGTLK
jgi:transposase